MKFRVQDEEVSYNLFNRYKGICFNVDVKEEAIIEVEKKIQNPTPLEKALVDTRNMLNMKEEKEIEEKLKEPDTLK